MWPCSAVERAGREGPQSSRRGGQERATGKGWGRGAAQGLEEGGESCPWRAPRRPTGSQTHAVLTLTHGHHTHTHSQACTHAHRLTHVTPTLAYTRMHMHTLTHTHAYRLAHTHTPGESEHSGELPAPSIHPPVPGVGRRGSWAPARALRWGPQIRGLCEGPRGAGTLTLGPALRPAASSLRMDPGAR